MLRAFVTAEPVEPLHHTTAYRATFLADAIYGQEEVSGSLRKVSKPSKDLDLQPLVDKLGRELSSLEERDGCPSALGKFNTAVLVSDLHLDQITVQMMEVVPGL